MTSQSHTVIEIYVAAHCFVSDYTREVIEFIREEFPSVELQIIDVDQVAAVPGHVFATPTYLVNGHLWSLGNPSLEQVRALLA